MPTIRFEYGVAVGRGLATDASLATVVAARLEKVYVWCLFHATQGLYRERMCEIARGFRQLEQETLEPLNQPL